MELGARRLTRFFSLPSGPTSFGRGVQKGEKWERLAGLDLEIFAIKLSGDPSSPSVRSLAREGGNALHRITFTRKTGAELYFHRFH